MRVTARSITDQMNRRVVPAPTILYTLVVKIAAGIKAFVQTQARLDTIGTRF